jgi:hypothetical protein
MIAHWILMGILSLVISLQEEPAEPKEETGGSEPSEGGVSPEEPKQPETSGEEAAAGREQRIRDFLGLARAILDDGELREHLKSALKGTDGEQARGTIEGLSTVQAEVARESAPPQPAASSEPQIDVPEDLAEEYNAQMGKESELVERFQQAEGSDEKEPVKEELRTVLGQLFEIREKARAREIERLTKQLQRLTERLAKRQEKRDEIVQRRLAQLLGIGDDLDW